MFSTKINWQVSQYSVLEIAVIFDSNCLHVALVQFVLIVLPFVYFRNEIRNTILTVFIISQPYLPSCHSRLTSLGITLTCVVN